MKSTGSDSAREW